MPQLDTRSVHAGRDDLTALGIHVPPIDLSTTYPLPDVDSGGAMATSWAASWRQVWSELPDYDRSGP